MTRTQWGIDCEDCLAPIGQACHQYCPNKYGRETGEYDCQAEFGPHDHTEQSPEECQRIIDVMVNGYPGPEYDIPWGTPDSRIPDNPNEDGFRQSDFI